MMALPRQASALIEIDLIFFLIQSLVAFQAACQTKQKHK